MNLSSPAWRVDLQLRPSRYFLLLTTLFHAGAQIAVWQTGLALAPQLVLGSLLLLSLALSFREERGKAGWVLREQEGRWWVQAGHREGAAELQGAQVWRYLVVIDLRCRNAGGAWKQRVVVLPDAIPADAFRRLRVRLRCGRPGKKRDVSILD